LEVFGAVAASHAHLFVEEEGLEDGIGGEREDGEEGVGNERRHDSHGNGGGNGLDDLQGGVRGDKDVTGERGERSNGATSEEHVDETNRVSETEAVSVLEHQSEGVPGRLEESGVLQRNLDVGVLGDVLHASLHHVEKRASEAEHDLNPLEFLVSGADLSAVVLEEEVDNLAHGDAERAKSDVAKMVAESPVEGTAEGVGSLGVGADFEVPEAGGASNNELSHSHDESVEPEEAEDVVQESVPGLGGPLDVCHELVVGVRLGGSNREDVDSAEDPEGGPHEFQDEHDEGQSEDLHVVLHIHGGGLEDSDTKLDGLVAAAQREQNDHVEHPQDVGSVLQILVVRVLNFVLSSLEVRVKSSA